MEDLAPIRGQRSTKKSFPAKRSPRKRRAEDRGREISSVVPARSFCPRHAPCRSVQKSISAQLFGQVLVVALILSGPAVVRGSDATPVGAVTLEPSSTSALAD